VRITPLGAAIDPLARARSRSRGRRQARLAVKRGFSDLSFILFASAHSISFLLNASGIGAPSPTFSLKFSSEPLSQRAAAECPDARLSHPVHE
jgi:hypothetical protein